MRAVPLLLLLALLPACGSGDDAPTASPSASPSPSPSPAPPLFGPATAQALLGAGDLPQGVVLPPQPGDPPASTLALCSLSTAPPPRAPVRRVQLAARQGGGLLSVDQTIAVLPDEAAAVALQQAVVEHARSCERQFQDEFPPEQGGGSIQETQDEPVPVTVGGWSGLRQTSRNLVSTPQRTSRSVAQSVVVRRSNAVVSLRVLREEAQPDLAAVLRPLLAQLDATAQGG